MKRRKEKRREEEKRGEGGETMRKGECATATDMRRGGTRRDGAGKAEREENRTEEERNSFSIGDYFGAKEHLVGQN